MAGLADTTVVEEVFVEFGLLERSVVVAVDEFIDRDAQLLSIRLENVSEMAGFGLWRNTQAGGTVPRQARNRVQGRLDHPVSVILLDSGLDGSLQPLLVPVHVASVELVEDLQCEVGEERRLGPSQILASEPAGNMPSSAVSRSVLT